MYGVFFVFFLTVYGSVYEGGWATSEHLSTLNRLLEV